MKGIYFEEKGLALLEQHGITKAEFARRMGIQRQNVNVLFKTNNLEIIERAANVLDVPLAVLVSYVDEPDISNLPIVEFAEHGDDCLEIRPEDVPVGNTAEDRRTRNQKGFKRMLIMEYNCPAIGMVRLTVGQKNGDGMKIQYCITAIEVHS